MQISCASEAAPGQVNEDYAICGPNWATVLDGATAPRGVDSGCIHNIPWLVHQLAATLSTKMLLDEAFPLTDMLAAAIEDTCSAHANTCDLQNPDSPSTTVSIIRISSDTLEYLTLGDSPIALCLPDNQITVLKDDRRDNSTYRRIRVRLGGVLRQPPRSRPRPGNQPCSRCGTEQTSPVRQTV